MAKATDKAITARYLTLPQAAAQITWDDLESALVEGRLFAVQRENWNLFEKLNRFLEGFALRGVPQADLDAVRAVNRGPAIAIPPRSWRRWFADGSVKRQGGKVVRFFEGYGEVIFQPVLLSTDVLAQPQRQLRIVSRSRPSRRRAPSTVDRDAAINNRLNKGERPGSTVHWSAFCHSIRLECGGFVGDPKDESYKRGFSDHTIKLATLELMKFSPHQA